MFQRTDLPNRISTCLYCGVLISVLSTIYSFLLACQKSIQNAPHPPDLQDGATYGKPDMPPFPLGAGLVRKPRVLKRDCKELQGLRNEQKLHGSFRSKTFCLCSLFLLLDLVFASWTELFVDKTLNVLAPAVMKFQLIKDLEAMI